MFEFLTAGGQVCAMFAGLTLFAAACAWVADRLPALPGDPDFEGDDEL